MIRYAHRTERGVRVTPAAARAARRELPGKERALLVGGAMDDLEVLIRRFHRAPLALLVPLGVGALLLGLSPQGRTGVLPPPHPRTLVDPCGAPRQPNPAPDGRTIPASSGEANSVLLRSLAERVGEELTLHRGRPLPSLSEERLMRLLVDLDLDAGRLERSLRTLAENDARADHWVHAGWRLEKGGQEQLALRAFHEALQRNPQCLDAYHALVRLDPSAALVALEHRAMGDHDSARSWRCVERARLLVACGRLEDARIELRSLPLDASTSDDYWRIFDELAPLEAADLQGERALRSGDGDAVAKFARRLHARGDVDAALELLTRDWADLEVARTMLATLSELDPVRADAVLRARLAERPDDGSLWQQFGENAFERGDVEGALDAWMQALTLDPWACDDYERLWQHRREPFLEAFWQGALREDCSWIWEECGDWLWRSGRSQRALDAWYQAVRLEPDDEGVLTKIERAGRGLWPL